MLPLGLAALLAVPLATDRQVRVVPQPRTPVATATTPTAITRPQTVAIGFVRAVARRQLRLADRRLDACGAQRTVRLTRRALPGWRDCVRWPIAHLAVGARTDAALLGGMSNELPLGRCRGLVLGTSNTARILSGEADELLRGLFNTSRAGRGLSDQRYASVRGLIGTVRGMIRGRTWDACRPTGRRRTSA
jgi:hypothetical protein